VDDWADEGEPGPHERGWVHRQLAEVDARVAPLDGLDAEAVVVRRVKVQDKS
jgi:hypothetical protein